MPVNMKNMIASAFAAMAQEKSVDKITVKDLVEACGISRQTFYYHFQDIMDVIEWSAQQVAQQMLEKSLQAETPEQAMQIFLTSSIQHQALLQRLLRSQKREQVELIIVQMLRSYLKDMLRCKGPDLPLNYSDTQIALDFCTYGIAGLLLEHCGQEHSDVEQLARQMYRLLSGGMFHRSPEGL